MKHVLRTHSCISTCHKCPWKPSINMLMLAFSSVPSSFTVVSVFQFNLWFPRFCLSEPQVSLCLFTPIDNTHEDCWAQNGLSLLRPDAVLMTGGPSAWARQSAAAHERRTIRWKAVSPLIIPTQSFSNSWFGENAADNSPLLICSPTKTAGKINWEKQQRTEHKEKTRK